MSTLGKDTFSDRKDDRAYDFHTTETILKLLSEYSAKLKEMAEQKYRLHTRLIILRLIVIGITGGIFTAVLWFYTQNQGFTKFAFSAPYFIISISGFILGAALVVVFRSELIKDELLIQEIDVSALKLEKLVRAASQITEHVEKDLGNRLELDLRLVEAESALRRARSFMGGVHRDKDVVHTVSDRD